jgi:hypothetical protein
MPTNSAELSIEITFLDHEAWWVRTLYQLLWLCLFVLIAWSLVLTTAIALHYHELVFHYRRLYQNPLVPTITLVFSWAWALVALLSWVASIALLSWVWAARFIHFAVLRGHVQAWQQRFRARYNLFQNSSARKDSNPFVGT